MKSIRPKGFTLIELLVVIAIIAILAAILFPVFAQAKTAAKKVQSINNIKQLAIASELYNNDFDDTFAPRYRLGYNAPNGPDDTQAMSWDKLIFPYTKNFQIVYSPMDPNVKFTTPYGTLRRSYAVAENVFRATQIRSGWGAIYNSGMGPLKASISTTAVPQPADSVAFGERRQCTTAADAWTGQSWFWCSDFYNTRRSDMPSGQGEGQIAYSYTDGSNFAFVDTHAKWFARSGKRLTDGYSIGTVFPGYEQKADWWVGSPSAYWDSGMSCTAAGRLASEGNCKLPGE